MRHRISQLALLVIPLVSIQGWGMTASLNLNRMSFSVDGVSREAWVHVPTNPTSAPVVFVFHGHGGTARNAARMFALHQLWPEAFCVYMQGLNTPGRLTDPEGKRTGWQASAGAQADRDLRFFDVVLDSLEKGYRIDEKRVYVTGHSNGGAFCYLLWEKRGDVLAALAPSAAAGRLKNARQITPKPLLHLAGTNDPLVNYEWQSATLQLARQINRCEPGSSSWAEKCQLFASKKAAPVVTFVHGTGHRFPEAGPSLIVRFFQEH